MEGGGSGWARGMKKNKFRAPSAPPYVWPVAVDPLQLSGPGGRGGGGGESRTRTEETSPPWVPPTERRSRFSPAAPDSISNASRWPGRGPQGCSSALPQQCSRSRSRWHAMLGCGTAFWPRHPAAEKSICGRATNECPAVACRAVATAFSGHGLAHTTALPRNPSRTPRKLAPMASAHAAVSHDTHCHT